MGNFAAIFDVIAILAFVLALLTYLLPAMAAATTAKPTTRCKRPAPITEEEEEEKEWHRELVESGHFDDEEEKACKERDAISTDNDETARIDKRIYNWIENTDNVVETTTGHKNATPIVRIYYTLRNNNNPNGHAVNLARLWFPTEVDAEDNRHATSIQSGDSYELHVVVSKDVLMHRGDVGIYEPTTGGFKLLSRCRELLHVSNLVVQYDIERNLPFMHKKQKISADVLTYQAGEEIHKMDAESDSEESGSSSSDEDDEGIDLDEEIDVCNLHAKDVIEIEASSGSETDDE